MERINKSNNGRANKKQRTDAEQPPQNPSESSQYFNAGGGETSPSSLFGAGQNSSTQQALRGVVTTLQSASWQDLTVQQDIFKQQKFFKKYGHKDYNLDEALVIKSTNAFAKHENILEMLECACCYFPTREKNQEIPSDQVIENAGAIAKAFSKQITYNENAVCTTSLKIEGEFINLYSKEERRKVFQPLKHIFTFLKKGDISSLEKIITLVDKKDRNTEFKKLLIKVILNYGDFASPTNRELLVSKLRELGYNGKSVSELRELDLDYSEELLFELKDYSLNLTPNPVPENPTNNFQQDSLPPPPVFSGVTTLQPEPWNPTEQKLLYKFKFFLNKYGHKDYNLDEDLVIESTNAFEKHKNVKKMLECACYYFITRGDNQAIPSDKVIENAGAIAKAFPKPIKYNENAVSAVSLKIGERSLYYRMELKLHDQPLKHIFTFLQSGKIKSLKNIIKLVNKKDRNTEFEELLIKVILNYGNFTSPTNSVKLVSKLEKLGYNKKSVSELGELGDSLGLTSNSVPEKLPNNLLE